MSGIKYTSPVTDDEAERLRPVVAKLLRVVPETWGICDVAGLTAAQERALYLLTAAGMVERRLRFRVSMARDPTSIEAVVTATGECGLGKAMNPLLAQAWALWTAQYESWIAGDARDTPPFNVQSLPPSEWRLTQCGILARNDLDAGDDNGIDYVLWRGVWDGRPRQGGRGGNFLRKPVAGHGNCESVPKQVIGAELPRVNVANWSEGADQLACRLSPEIAALLFESFKAKAPPKSGPGPIVAKGGARDLMVALLTKHHQYAEDGCLNFDPISLTTLAKMGGVAKSTASDFFKAQFSGHAKYKAVCADKGNLIASLKLLNNEFAPHNLFGHRTPGEPDRDK